MDQEFFSTVFMNSSQVLQCSIPSTQTHSGTLFYCLKCIEIVCSECLITHLCSIFHEKNLVQKIEEAASNGFVRYSSLQDQLQVKLPQDSSMPIVSNNTNNIESDVDKFINQSESDANKLFTEIKSQTMTIQDNLSKLFGLLRRKDKDEEKANIDKEIVEIEKELNFIKGNWNNINLFQQIHYLKKLPLYDAKINDIIMLKEKIDEKDNNNNNGSYKEKELKNVNRLVSEIKLDEFALAMKNQTEVINQRINKQIYRLENNIIDADDFENKPKEDIKHEPMSVPASVPVQEEVIVIKPIAIKSKKLIQHVEVIDIIEQPNNHDVPMPDCSSMIIEPKIKIPIPKESVKKIPKCKIKSQQKQKKSCSFFNGELLFSLKRKDNLSAIKLFVYMNQKVKSIEVNPANFDDCYSDFFPFKNNKTINLGNTLMITGGNIDGVTTNTVFVLSFNEENSIKISHYKAMLFNRESHNILYVPKSNSIIVSSGQSIVTGEKINLSSSNAKWAELPNLNKVRANGTMVLLNESNVFCIGGYNHLSLTYVNGYERLNLNKIAEGWKLIVLNEDLAISTMGIVMLKPSSVLLIGGFKGGNSYLQDGIVFEEEEQSDNVIIEKKEKVVSNGLIFYSSPIFFQIDSTIVNFDFGQNLVIFDPELQKAKIISSK